jgi:hypothetical protein
VTATAAGLGAAIALVSTPFLPAGLPVLLALAGVVVLAGRRRSAPSAREPSPGPVTAPAGASAGAPAKAAR